MHLRHTLVHFALRMNLPWLALIKIKPNALRVPAIIPLLFDTTITFFKSKGSTFFIKPIFRHAKLRITVWSVGTVFSVVLKVVGTIAVINLNEVIDFTSTTTLPAPECFLSCLLPVIIGTPIQAELESLGDAIRRWCGVE